MANLRTNNLSGEGGRRAYRGSVYFDGRDDVTFMQVIGLGGAADFTLGTGDFTIEMWINHGATRSFEILYDARRDGSSDVAPMIYLVDGVVYYYTAGGNRITGSSTLTLNSWHHIAVARQSGSTKLYVNGIQEGSTYSDSNSYVAKHNRPIIGGEGPNPGNNPFNGHISNLRVCKGHAVYTANFEPPTSELTYHYINGDDKTILLCCQDSDDPLKEETGKELLGQGGLYRGKRFSNIATNGDLETGDTTNWNNGGCATFEISNRSHSGSYSLHAVTDSNGDAVSYTIPVSLDIQKRYKISAYVLVAGPGGTSARAKMKIGSGTGGNENYESEVLGAGNNGLNKWAYIEWIGMATADTTHVTFNESSANNVNDYYVDDLRIELWYPEEGENILANPGFKSNSTGAATGWSFTTTPSGEYTIADNKLSVADNSRTNDAIASQALFFNNIAEGRYRVTIDYSISSGDFDLGIGNNRMFGVANTFAGGAGNTDSFTHVLNAGNGNNLFRIVANQHCVGDFFNVTLTRIAEPEPPKITPPYGADAGNTFGGSIAMNSLSYMYFPTGRADERGRGRALFMGGSQHPSSPNLIKSIDYVEMTSSGVAVRFGDLTTTNCQSAAFASSTRGINAAGQVSAPGDNQTDIIEFVTIATEGNGTDFGNLDAVHRRLGGSGHSSETRGIIAGGSGDSPGETNVIQYITIASTGDATNFGDLLNPKDNFMAKNGSSTRMLMCGGRDYTPSSTVTNTIEYITIATLSDSQNFGDLSQARFAGTGCGSATRGVIAGGQTPTYVNTIDYVTIASTGDATDFGDLTATLSFVGGANNSIKGIFAGGATPTKQSTMSSIEIATTGNAVEFGDNKISNPLTSRGTCSDSHGGLT